MAVPSTFVRNLKNAPLPPGGPVIDVAPNAIAPRVAPAAAAPAGAAAINATPGLGAALMGLAALAGREIGIGAGGGRKVYKSEAEREAAKPKNIRKNTLSYTPEQIIEIEKTDPIAAKKLRDIQTKYDARPLNRLGQVAETVVDAAPGFFGNVVRKGKVSAEDSASVQTPVVQQPATTPAPTSPAAAQQGDFLSGLKDFFIDKERGGMTMHGLLTLGALARAVTGAREGAAGMAGGGLESANLASFMGGAAQGVAEKQKDYAADKLARDKIAAEKEIAQQKLATEGKKQTAQEKYAERIILNQSSRPDWTTDEVIRQQVSDAHKNEQGDMLRYWYFYENFGPAIAEHFLNQGGSVSPAVAQVPVNGGAQAAPGKKVTVRRVK